MRYSILKRKKQMTTQSRMTWADLDFWKSEVWFEIQGRLDGTNEYYPRKTKIFRALTLTPLDKVKVVILGQDPYHTTGMADGLAFSTNSHIRPPSLNNIFKEMIDDLHIFMPNPDKNSLLPWAEEGVLLLNTILTVAPHLPLSHSAWGWQKLTQEIVQVVSLNNPIVTFVLWGTHAQEYEQYIDGSNVIKSTHPAPMSAHKGFFGSKPFSKVNQYLLDWGEKSINWRL